jgi:hypothetical protein
VPKTLLVAALSWTLLHAALQATVMITEPIHSNHDSELAWLPFALLGVWLTGPAPLALAARAGKSRS